MKEIRTDLFYNAENEGLSDYNRGITFHTLQKVISKSILEA